MHTHLPTCVFGTWTVTSLRDSLLAGLVADREATTLRLFYYAVTTRGWDEVRKVVQKWRRARNGRVVTAIIGTDHAITEPGALRRMQADGIQVRVMTTYQGVFHPKVIWLCGNRSNTIWVASNNLTRDGLLNNIEFAITVTSATVPEPLSRWAQVVEAGSVPLTAALLGSYESEKRTFEQRRARSNATTYTWSKKREPAEAFAQPVAAGDLIIEIMPKETGTDGKQVQLPMRAAREFFGVRPGRSAATVRMRAVGSTDVRTLTMTIFGNTTVRLSINELDYRDRPCVIVFHRASDGVVEFEIVARSIFPGRYRTLLGRCTSRTRAGSRRWTIL